MSKETRRKLSVHVTGAKEKSQQDSATNSAAGTSFGSEDPTATAASAEHPAAVDSADVNAADSAAANGNIRANSDVPSAAAVDRVQLIKDIWAFKRSQLLYPSVK